MRINTMILSLLCGLFVLTACSDSDVASNNSRLEDAVYSVSDDSVMISNIGGEQMLTFTPSDKWTLECSESWVTLSQTEGQQGDAAVKIVADKNDSGDTRSAYLTLKVNGYSPVKLCTVTQKKMVGEGLGVNYWMADYMTTHYLWNDEFKTISGRLDYTLEPEAFLNSALSKMSTNTDDGYNSSDGRIYYSNIQSFQNNASSKMLSAPTREVNNQYGYGIGLCQAGVFNQAAGLYYLIVNYVYAGSPAAAAGIKRGSLITKVNGSNLTEANINESFYMLLGLIPTDNLTLEVRSFVSSGNNNFTVSDGQSVRITPTQYDANPIMCADVLGTTDGKHKIGYFSYQTFDLYHDSDIITAFKNFKTKGVTDLVLDLRYNTGGYVYSSTLLATAILGDSYKGQVYSHMQYNKERTNKGEEDFFYIGTNPSMTEYPLIGQALTAGLGLKRVYVLTTENTASASELVINGLRGLDIEVITIGTTTNGKNCGMELLSSAQYTELYDFGNYSYEFAPITFYNLNAKGSKDYANGFKPNYEINESSYVYGDWTDYAMDPLLNMAAYHITYGYWPMKSRTSQNMLNSQLVTRKSLGTGNSLKGSMVFGKNATK